jgi:hypothetical protein
LPPPNPTLRRVYDRNDTFKVRRRAGHDTVLTLFHLHDFFAIWTAIPFEVGWCLYDRAEKTSTELLCPWIIGNTGRDVNLLHRLVFVHEDEK